MPGDEHEIVEHMRPPGDSRGNDVLVGMACAVSAVSSLVFAGTLLAGGPLVLYGGALTVALLALALAVRRFFAAAYPLVELAEERGPGDEEVNDGPLAVVTPVRRRRLLKGVLLGGAGVIGAGLIAPVSTLGPRPRDISPGTAWTAGTRLVTVDGRPVSAGAVPLGGLGIVWPEGGERDELASVVLVRLAPGEVEPPTNPDWVVGGELVAYSKVCTHVGCPVGLFQSRTGSLFCPCHQQSFDAGRGARPLFGPASRPLPQLPLGVDADGYLIALGDFADPVGPPAGVRDR